MKSFSVLERPPSTDGDPDFVLVKEGFNWWAFLLPPLWLLLRQQWLGLAAFIAAGAVLALISLGLHLHPGYEALLSLLLAYLCGAEANHWRCWRLLAAGYRDGGIIRADSREVAEIRWVEHWLAGQAPAAPRPAPQVASKPTARRPGPLQPFANPFDPM